MNEIKLYYWDEAPNMGDAVNKLLCEKLFNISVLVSNPNECEAAFCGSLLDDFLYKNFWPVHIKQRKIDEKSMVHIWGAGFIADKWHCASWKRKLLPETYFRGVKVHAVRGALSRKRLEKIVGKSLKDVPLADPGLLVSDLVEGVDRIYDLGIVVHHLEKNLPIYHVFEKYNNAHFIDVEDEPLKCIIEISKCKCILSSSLHGLIFADSFGIPNARLVASNLLKGGDYKFEDYYSSYNNSERKCFDLRKNIYIDLQEVFETYVLDKAEVECKKQLLYKSFPKCFL